MDWYAYLTFSANVSRTVTEGHKFTLGLAALALLLLWRPMSKSAKPLAAGLLTLLCLLSTANYLRWGPKIATERVDSYDLIHYYLNAKYFDELGYLDLYPAVMLVDHEHDGPYFKKQGPIYMAQDETGHSMKPIAHALARGRVVRAENFSPERWKDFEHDFLYLQRERHPMGSRTWRQMIQDHGFNGTPVWTLLARPIAEWVPVEYIKAIGFIDVALLAIAFGAVIWAYGWLPAMWAYLFMMLCYSLRWPTVSWVFLRYDWVAGLLIAMALLKKERPYLAGLFAGWAATLRMFPAFWMWGPFAKGVHKLFVSNPTAERSASFYANLPARFRDVWGHATYRRLLIFAFGWFVMVGVLEAGALVRFGVHETTSHFENMLDHNSAEQLSSRRIGLALALPFRGPGEVPHSKQENGRDCKFVPCRYIEKWRKKEVDSQKPIRYGLALLVMLVMGWGMRNARDDEAFGYGFIPIFLLTTMSYYYYVARVTLALVHASDLEKTRNKVGLLLLFGIEVFSHWAETRFEGHRVFLVGYVAWALAAYVLLMMGFMLWDARKEGESAPSGN